MMPAAPSPKQPLALAVGATVADFRLPDGGGRGWSLADLAGDGGAVLVFFRGVW